MIASAMPINETVQDHNVEGRCDTTDNQKDKEELVFEFQQVSDFHIHHYLNDLLQ
jgi:hypothetical protein